MNATERDFLKNPVKSNGELDSIWAQMGRFNPNLHMKFTTKLDPEAFVKLKKMFEDSHIKQKNTTIPLFVLRNRDVNGQEITYHNMTFFKISIKCSVCDFKLKLNQHQILKRYREHKTLNLEPAKEHIKKTGHSLHLNQVFEKYR